VYLRANLHVSLTGFERRDTNVVDYVELTGSMNYQAENLPALHYRGVEAAVAYEPRASQHIAVSFSALHGQFASPENIVTEYTFNYPVYDGVVEWRGALSQTGLTKNVIARTRIGVVGRVARGPYAVWDASAGYGTGRVRPFLQLTNITSTVYQDIPLVAMPKRGVVAGVELYVFGASR
jgi:iron complex outermembrane receptor protein